MRTNITIWWEKYNFPKIIILSIIIALIIDWSRIFQSPIQYNLGGFSIIFKVLAFVLINLIAWTASGRGHSTRDEKFFKFLFTCIPLADILFVLHDYDLITNKPFIASVGVFIFMIVQLSLTLRNLAGFKFSTEELKQNALPIIITATIFWPIGISVIIGLYTVFGVSYLFVLLNFYLVILFLSVTAAVISHFNKNFPTKNTKLMMYGLISFASCDLIYFWNIFLFKESIAKIFTTNLSLMFYLPALLMIAMSVWKYDEEISRNLLLRSRYRHRASSSPTVDD